MRQYSQTAFPDHSCGACGHHHWGVVKFYASDGSDHRKVGCKACHAPEVFHPDDITVDMFGERSRGRSIHVRLKKEWADAHGVFLTLAKDSGDFVCMIKGCGSRDVQHHHYAPKAFFGLSESDAFGTVPLCTKHHDRWHQVINDHMRRTR